LKNKAVLTALFLSLISFINAALPASAALPRTTSFSAPLSIESPFHSAFLGIDSAAYDRTVIIAEPVMHNALAENSGQTDSIAVVDDVHDFTRRFSLPARGINWGVLHGHNAIDIAGACGSRIYAAAAGQIVDVRIGWEGGYGNYVDIDHGNSVVTRYAHVESVVVKKGQMVAQGDVVAYVGNTGNSTGCHLHFEVLGPVSIINPFVLR